MEVCSGFVFFCKMTLYIIFGCSKCVWLEPRVHAPVFSLEMKGRRKVWLWVTYDVCALAKLKPAQTTGSLQKILKTLAYAQVEGIISIHFLPLSPWWSFLGGLEILDTPWTGCQVTVNNHLHSHWGQFRVAGSPISLWEETQGPRENRQTPYRMGPGWPRGDLNPQPSCCEATVVTTGARLPRLTSHSKSILLWPIHVLSGILLHTCLCTHPIIGLYVEGKHNLKTRCNSKCECVPCATRMFALNLHKEMFSALVHRCHAFALASPLTSDLSAVTLTRMLLSVCP